MLDFILFSIRSFSSALGVILNINIPLTAGVSIQFVDLFLFVFVLGAFIKFFSIITHKSTYSKRD